MSSLFMLVLLVCACAGIVSEAITITVPNRVIDILRKDPEELIQKPFYKFLLFLSGLYIGFVILLFFSGIDKMRYYGIIIIVLSTSGWLLRARLEKFTFLIIINSTVCLIFLVDVIRTIGFYFFNQP